MSELKEQLTLIAMIQGIFIIAFILQIITNLIIIFQLPKIKDYTKLIFQKAYGIEELSKKDENNSSKNAENQKIILINILVGIIIIITIIGISEILSMFFKI